VPATVTVSLFGTPNPGMPGALISFPVTITGNLGPNDTDIQGSATVVANSPGGSRTIANIPMVYSGGPPNSVVMYEFTASATFPAGNYTIVATFTSTDPSTAGASSSVVEMIREPGDITMPPVTTSVIGVSRHKQLVKETVKLSGTSTTPIQGHFYLAVENLNPAITLINATGKTVNQPPIGTPYVSLVASSISKKHSTKVKLVFDDLLPGKVAFTPVLLETTGTP
jgi:hypothetical protein